MYSLSVQIIYTAKKEKPCKMLNKGYNYLNNLCFKFNTEYLDIFIIIV